MVNPILALFPHSPLSPYNLPSAADDLRHRLECYRSVEK